MIAYNNTNLDNRDIGDQADAAFAENCINKEEYDRIKAGYPSGFYTPNIYIRIGLFLLTVVIVSFTLGLLFLMTAAAGRGEGIGVLLIIMGLLCYIGLEYLVHNKNHFRSGVDDALLWMAVTLLYSGLMIGIEPTPGPLAGYIILFILAAGGWWRFADRLLAFVMYAALLGVIYNLVAATGSAGRHFLSFVLMGAAVAVYFVCASLYSRERFRYYRESLGLLKGACLISFYGAGNYFIVREATVLLFNGGPDTVIPMGWLFWVFTLSIPLFYIGRGLQKKDKIFLWVGLGLIAATIATVRHYYHLLPLELAMTLGGILLIAIAYAAIRYLKTPRHGFTYMESSRRQGIENLHLESLVIAETFTPVAPPPAAGGFQFGGGTGGGGGAGGEY